ncbi:MAG: hypothetical protein Q8P67_03390 [archaeon]|nr:hypothetical protein [archaeon]
MLSSETQGGMGQRWKRLWCASGLITCFLAYGVLQERLMTLPFGEESKAEVFSSSEFLVMMNRIVAVLVALACLGLTQQPFRPQAAVTNYMAISFANTVGALCQYESLKYVSFPSQTFTKCAKMLPILCIGSLLGTGRYTWKDWLYSLSIMFGCSVFILSGEQPPSRVPSDDSSLLGPLLLFVFLFTDGFTSTLQERLFRSNRSSTYNQMLYNNLVSLCICVVTLELKQGLAASLLFCLANPTFLLYSLALSLSAALGQVFIYYTIQELGALFYSVCMVSRQLVSIILSCILFLHPLKK